MNKDKEPCFFLHIPKKAGTGFTSILDQLFQFEDICPIYYTFELINTDKNQLAKYQLFPGHIYYNVLSKLLGKPLNILTFVRNPIDYTISVLYGFKKVESLKSLPGRGIYNRRAVDTIGEWENKDFLNISLEDFVFNDTSYHNLQVRRLIENNRYFNFDTQNDPPSSVIITQGSSKDLEQAKKLLANSFFVGVTERFEESLMLFSYLVGIRPVHAMPRLNISTGRPSQDIISPEILQTINTFSALDVELYNFVCQLFEDRFSAMWKDLLGRYSSTPDPDVTGEGEAPAATRPSNQQIYDLLDQHYQANFKALNPPLTTLTYTLDQPLSGEGWYIRENNPGYGYIRWSGPGLSASLHLPLAAHNDLLIRIEILNALKKELVESFSLEVNRVEVPLAFSYGKDFKTLTFEGVLKAETLQKNPGLTTLILKVGETIDLKILNPTGGDNRVLGIALKRIEIAPL